MFFQQSIETLALHQLRKLQNERLKQLVKYVYARIPFYKSMFDEVSLHPSSIQSVNDLHKIPFTKKSDLSLAFLYLCKKQNCMPEIIVKYKSKRTLQALQDFAKYFDYVISSPDSEGGKKKQISLNGVTIIPADSSVDTSGISNIFEGKNINPDQLRNEAWQRKK
jgi:hypothetical protein